MYDISRPRDSLEVCTRRAILAPELEHGPSKLFARRGASKKGIKTLGPLRRVSVFMCVCRTLSYQSTDYSRKDHEYICRYPGGILLVKLTGPEYLERELARAMNATTKVGLCGKCLLPGDPNFRYKSHVRIRQFRGMLRRTSANRVYHTNTFRGVSRMLNTPAHWATTRARTRACPKCGPCQRLLLHIHIHMYLVR